MDAASWNGAATPTATGSATSRAGANGSPATSPRIGTFHALTYRNYRLLWLGDVFNSFAMWIQQTTMGWLVYDLTGSGSILGLMNGIRALPTLLLLPIAGAATDRMSRIRLVTLSQLLQFSATFILALDVLAGTVAVWHLLTFALIVTSAQVFNQPARQALIFDLVPRSVVANAVGLGHMAFSVSRSVGPAIGGALIVWLGAATNFFIQAFGYLAVMMSILLIQLPAIARRPSERKPAMFRDIAEGFHFVAGDPEARILMALSMIYPTFIIPVHMSLMPIFAKRVFETDAGGLGILLASVGVGGMIGGLAAASLNQFERRGLLQLYSLFLCAVPVAAFSIAGEITGGIWLGAFFLLLSGIGGAMFMTTNQTVVQLLAPDHMRGRLASIMQITQLLSSAGMLCAGTAADLVGAVAVGTTLGVGATVVGLSIFLFSPRMRSLRLS